MFRREQKFDLSPSILSDMPGLISDKMSGKSKETLELLVHHVDPRVQGKNQVIFPDTLDVSSLLHDNKVRVATPACHVM